MKDRIAAIWKRFQDGEFTLEEMYHVLCATLINDDDVDIWEIIVNREEAPKLEVIVEEDQVLFEVRLTDQQAQDLVRYGASEV